VEPRPGGEPLDLGELPRHEPQPVRRRRLPPRLVALAVVVLLLGAVLGWVADERVREGEDARLADCSEQARAAALRADLVMGAIEQYLRPVLAVPDGPRESYHRILAEEAASVTPGLAEARDACAAVEVLVLHRAHVAERDALVAYLVARHDSLAAVAADGSRYLEADPEASAELGRLRRSAGLAVGDRP